jgi:negative regulator of flagellin synthesis FlgM
MRITSIGNIMDSYKTQKTTSIGKTKSKVGNDVLDISSVAKEYQVAKVALNKQDDVRQSKIEDIKNRIQSGNYNVSAKEIADKMVDNMFDTNA